MAKDFVAKAIELTNELMGKELCYWFNVQCVARDQYEENPNMMAHVEQFFALCKSERKAAGERVQGRIQAGYDFVKKRGESRCPEHREVVEEAEFSSDAYQAEMDKVYAEEQEEDGG